jgi:hypothetical protein
MLDFRYVRMRFDALVGNMEREAQQLAATINWTDRASDLPTVLCLTRAQFKKDIEELRTRTHYNWATVRATAVKHAQEAWVNEVFRHQTYIAHYLESSAQHLRPWLQRFGELFLDAAGRVHPISAVMAGNTDYWQDEALKLGCRSRNIPFLVLGRENYTKKVDADRLRQHFVKAQFRFTGAGVAVLSSDTRDVMVGSGSFKAEDVWVTGAPRYDRWHDVKALPMAERNHIVLLSYADPVYLAQKNFAECVALFAAEAKRYADRGFKFVIKVKKESEVKPVEAALPSIHDYPVEIVWDAPLYEMFPRSRIVIGYNTLAAVEALLTEVPVVMPSWGDARREMSEVLMHFANPADANVAYFPDSPEALQALIKTAIDGALTTKGSYAERRARFTQHIGLPETGTSSAAVEKFVDHYVGRAAAAGKAR